jgi:ABC-type transport system involved in cytochrome c biogenesis permease subunit
MKHVSFWVVLLIAIAWLSETWRPLPVPEGKPDLAEFGRIPVLAGGRIKPLDTVARNSLVIIHGRQSVRTLSGEQVPAIRWLADTLFDPATADGYLAFQITHPDVLGLFGWEQTDRKFFTYRELQPFFQQIDEQGRHAEEVNGKERNTFQTAILNLRNAIVLYQRLKNSIEPEALTGIVEAKEWERIVPAARALLQSGSASSNPNASSNTNEQPTPQEQAAALLQLFQDQASFASFLAIPTAAAPTPDHRDWLTTGAAMLKSVGGDPIPAALNRYGALASAYRSGDIAGFQANAVELRSLMAAHDPRSAGRARFEALFNRLEPFYRAMGLYVLAALFACGSWAGWSAPLRRGAVLLILSGFALHTFGLGARMFLQERPPVTNLYSSAIFIGWGTIIVALLLERIYKDGIGAACAGAIGFLTLIIAHHLAGTGDTLEMLQAVLDTNIWLATHVVVITCGYSAMFLAGTLALIYLIRGMFTRSLNPTAAKGLARTVYGVVCFATFASFVGTVLGGIWADQSWGRFWGWDPKENGALLIVLWCAIILHARLMGLVRDRGLVLMAIFGNVVTSFSWFGVNMLGIGLHSYGFMEKALPWLAGFMLSQMVFIAVGSLPLEHWKSFQGTQASGK